MSEEMHKGNNIWGRSLYMLLFVLFYSVAEFVLTVTVVVQFFYQVFNARSHPRLLSLGAALAAYIYQVVRFLTFNSEVMPYPFSEWPEGEEPERPAEPEALPGQEGKE